MPHLLVFGARNLGRVVAEHLMAQGWEATGVSRTEGAAAASPETGLVPDATTAEGIRSVVERAKPFDLAVNAVSPKGRFGGGDLVTTDDDAMAPYVEQVLPTAFAFFRICGAALIERGAGTIIQVTGGSARRALPGRAPWGAGAAGPRALSPATAGPRNRGTSLQTGERRDRLVPERVVRLGDAVAAASGARGDQLGQGVYG